jgi:hypothetical protein
MGVGGQHHALATLPPGKRPGTQGEWVDLRVSLDGCRKSHPPMGFNLWTVQSTASHYNKYALPAHFALIILLKIRLKYM